MSDLTLAPGTRVAHFRVLRELGRGGYGIVHLAEDVEIPGRVVALKSVRPGPGAPDAESLRHEASALAALQHPNILVVHEIGEGPAGIFLVTEFMPGGSVQERIADGAIPLDEALRLARAAAAALAAAHAAGIVHRDFKPANLLLAADGLLKVADFGIALYGPAAAREDAPTLPARGNAVLDTTMTARSDDGRGLAGTPAYMPPELMDGAASSARGDQFSFGVVLHEMLTGAYPFDLAERLHATQGPPRLDPALPADLRKVVARCLEHEPSMRYPGMAAVVAALDAARLRRSPERKRTWRVATAGVSLVTILVLGYFGYRTLQLRKARSLNEQGRAALERGDRDAARAAFVAAHSADASYLPACTNLGQMASIEANPSWAETILRDCAAAFPASAAIRYNLGAVLVKSNELPAALAQLAKALELAGTSELRPLAANELALAHIAAGRPREAIALLESEQPNVTSVEGAIQVRTLGLAYLEAGDARRAIEALTSALAGRLPGEQRPAALVALGRAAEAAGAPNEAVLHYSQALVEGASEEPAKAAREGLARLQPSLR